MGMERRVNSLEVVALFKLEAPQMVVEADIPKDVLLHKFNCVLIP